jgi:hypothetical protein
MGDLRKHDVFKEPLGFSGSTRVMSAAALQGQGGVAQTDTDRHDALTFHEF